MMMVIKETKSHPKQKTIFQFNLNLDFELQIFELQIIKFNSFIHNPNVWWFKLTEFTEHNMVFTFPI